MSLPGGVELEVEVGGWFGRWEGESMMMRQQYVHRLVAEYYPCNNCNYCTEYYVIVVFNVRLFNSPTPNPRRLVSAVSDKPSNSRNVIIKLHLFDILGKYGVSVMQLKAAASCPS